MRTIAAVVMIFYFYSVSAIPLIAQEEDVEGVSRAQDISGQQMPNAKVVIKEHPKTAHVYVSLVDQESDDQDAVTSSITPIMRPAYDLLTDKSYDAQKTYTGPHSDRTKVYVFAGTLMAAGIATGIVGVTAGGAVAAGSSASGGAGVFTASGTTVGVVTLSSVLHCMKERTEHDEFTHTSHAQLLPE